MEGNSQKKWIIALVVALVIVTGLWLREVNKPSGVEQFKAELVDLQTKMGTACADTSTDEKKAGCTDALNNLKSFLDSLK